MCRQNAGTSLCVKAAQASSLSMTCKMTHRKIDFERIVRENKDTIFTVCYMFSKDENEVADLFQESLINLWKGLENMKNQKNVKGWIYRITMNTCISLAREKKRRSTPPLSMDVDLFDEQGSQTGQVAMLHKRICQLQPFDRAIVLLWLEDISYEEIGQILGISTKNVSVRLVRIREQLKRLSDTDDNER